MIEFILDNTVGAAMTAFFAALGTFAFNLVVNNGEVIIKRGGSISASSEVNFLILITLLQVVFWKSLFSMLAAVGGFLATIYSEAGTINSIIWALVNLSHFIPNLIVIIITVLMLLRFRRINA